MAGGETLEQVFDHYAGKFPRLQELRSSIVIACNQNFAEASTEVLDGDEIAFLPPVSGGSAARNADSDHYFALTRDPIDTQSVRTKVLTPEDGAVVVFEGVVRNNTKGRATKFLDYECYEPMALKIMAEIGLRYRRESRDHPNRHGSPSRANGYQRNQRPHCRERAASETCLRRGVRGHQPSEEAGPDLEERTFRRWRSVGGRGMGRRRPATMIQSALVCIAAVAALFAQEPVFKVDVRLVRMVATVKDATAGR